MGIQYSFCMNLISSQWIAQCAQCLAGRWRKASPPKLEEVAIDLWRDEQLRKLDPKEAAAQWIAAVDGESGR